MKKLAFLFLLLRMELRKEVQRLFDNKKIDMIIPSDKHMSIQESSDFIEANNILEEINCDVCIITDNIEIALKNIELINFSIKLKRERKDYTTIEQFEYTGHNNTKRRKDNGFFI